ncbi:MAG: threonine synthase [Spirochaetales bacterium]|nr:threonine synthase [Spirochaetales bacterium]
MRFVSSRATDARKAVDFREAVFAGLAPDGGLYVPVEQPDLSSLFESFSPQTSFQELARQVCGALFAGELEAAAVARIVDRAFSFAPVLRPVEEGLFLLELFHGPTCAFKDFGASFLAAVMEEYLQEEDRRALILVATSGDTGSAVARAFFRRRNLDVVILYPSGRVSPLQEQQLTTLGENVTALEVLGSFDDCQRLAKQAFLDQELQGFLRLTSANSINLGRLIPQSLYYIYGVAQAGGDGHGPLYYCVPSGNFGNLTAGVYAWAWGLPVQGFLAATNRNDVVPEYLRTGDFRPRPSVQTLSNAMDVGNPSNFERLLQVFHRRREEMSRLIRGVAISDADTRLTMRRVYDERGILLDPHTAVGVLASRRLRRELGEELRVITLGTAHPGKFLEIVRETTGVNPELPESLRAALVLPKQALPLEPKLEALKSFLRDRYG